MKTLHYLLGLVASIGAVIVVVVTSFEIAAYSNFRWYEKEYEKYNVLPKLEMEMGDVMEVTEEMMAYLRGNREDLVVQTKVNGTEREFFNDREKAHMIDVKEMFLGGLQIRKIGTAVIIIAVALLVITKANLKKVLPNTFLVGTGSLIGVTAVFGAICMSDFNKYFLMFHHVFFDNDLWLLDPDTDLMIRMLPEGFFMDMVARIGIIMLILLGILLALSIVLNVRNKKNL